MMSEDASETMVADPFDCMLKFIKEAGDHVHLSLDGECGVAWWHGTDDRIIPQGAAKAESLGAKIEKVGEGWCATFPMTSALSGAKVGDYVFRAEKRGEAANRIAVIEYERTWSHARS